MFLPGDELEDGDELTYDRSAYEMYHAVRQSAVCVNKYNYFFLAYLFLLDLQYTLYIKKHFVFPNLKINRYFFQVLF